MPAAGKPIVKIIRIRMMVEEHTYRRFRLNFLRIHRQAVMGNERRYFYDYYMLCCGPVALPDRVENPDERLRLLPPMAGSIADALRRATLCRSRARDADHCQDHLARLHGTLGSCCGSGRGKHSRKTPVSYSGRDIRERHSHGGFVHRTGHRAVRLCRDAFSALCRLPVHAGADSYLGIAVDVACLWMFHRTHSDLGENWSVSLDLRERHTLVTTGVYALVRHPCIRRSG